MKQYLTIEQLGSEKRLANSRAADFAADYSPSHRSHYMDDLIREYADSNTSIYYCDIRMYVFNNIDAVTDVINEYGWESCGSDLYKAGQIAEYDGIVKELYNNLDDIKYDMALYYAIDSKAKLTAEDLEDLDGDLDELEDPDDIADWIDNCSGINKNDDEEEDAE